MLNKCPHSHCEMVKTYDSYSCKKHWLVLPVGLRETIWRSWKRKNMHQWLQADRQAKTYWETVEAEELVEV